MGKRFSEEHKRKMSESSKGKPSSFRGLHISDDHKLKISKRMMGNKHTLGHKHTEETKRKMRLAHLGEFCSEEKKNKIRLARIKSLELNYGQIWPNYNPRACEYFREFDIVNGTKGQYAMYGGGEYQVKELGYFVDYFNADLNLIMEYDEPHHYDDQGNLREKDVKRQREIQALYPDFEFRRIQA
jgi:hypothetical protein